MTRYRKIPFAVGCAFILSLAFVIYERSRYNVVSNKELLTVREKLKALSPEEKKDLTYFANDLIVLNQFSYALVGHKPMSISCVIVEDTEDLLPGHREAFKAPCYQTLKRGYLIWEKYQSLFPLKKQILISYPFLGTGRREIAVICPDLCMATIEENVGDFREILKNQDISSKEIFGIVTHPEDKCMPVDLFLKELQPNAPILKG
ncbi:MAG: hypothetical protein KGI80_05805 [Verrucomicrobiota bacterium]|nr:hypothetical protein [Verrucomicrobiota bacterium]